MASIRARTGQSRGVVGLLIVVSLAVVLLVGGVSPPQAPLEVTSSSAEPVASVRDRVARHVVVISVDGLRSGLITKMGRSALPAYHRLIRQGATTLNARTAAERTQTLPNHTGMMTGRRVTTVRGHGVTFNHDNGATVHAVASARYVSSVFDVVHDRGGVTSLYTAKAKFRLFARTWNRDGRPDRVGTNHGTAKIDRFVHASDARLVRLVNQRLRTRPDTLTFLHLGAPDRTGHSYGFTSARYRSALRATDRQIGSILRTIASTPSLRRTTTVVLTSDHGGLGRGHAAVNRRANYTVPFMVWGVGVAQGRNLYALNPDRRRPGARWLPSYAGKQPIRNAEVANLVTDLLGMPSVPGSQLNRRQTLDIA